MNQISCIGRDGVTRTFEVVEEQDQFDPDVWNYRVHTIPRQPNGEAFDLTVTVIGPATVQITALAANGVHYSGMGIPEPLLRFVASSLKKTITSSPTTGGAGMWRTPAATKMWKRLESDGCASFDPIRDIYTFNP